MKTGKKDLLKEAIADAKAVKETALANAKIALEEAFTPRLQSMLSHKLAEELEDDETLATEEDEMMMGTEEGYGEGYEGEEDETMTTEEEEEMENPEITELKRIRERISKRLTELESSAIGTGDNKVDDYTSDTEDPGEGDLFAEEEGDEEVNLDEVIRALREMNGDVPAEDEEDTAGMTEEEAEEMKSDLEEAYKVIKSLKNTINEVNLLNAKLLYTNKLFRNFDLNEKQKVKVVENFDRASSLREVKLVFATLGENLNVARKTQNRVVKESFASRPTKGTKPAGIITEGSSLAARFQKLANIKK